MAVSGGGVLKYHGVVLNCYGGSRSWGCGTRGVGGGGVGPQLEAIVLPHHLHANNWRASLPSCKWAEAWPITSVSECNDAAWRGLVVVLLWQCQAVVFQNTAELFRIATVPPGVGEVGHLGLAGMGWGTGVGLRPHGIS
jgi:hypothetical protein